MRLVEFVKRPGPSLFHRFGMVDDQVAIRVSIFASSPSRFRQRGAGLSTVDKGRERERQRGAELVHGGQKVGGGRALTGVHTDQPLIGGRPVPIGRYELRFAVGKYFAARGVPLSDPPFLDDIPLRFSVGEPEGYLHVPLFVTPWSYATYRGS
jgi:hypothetical protein